VCLSIFVCLLGVGSPVVSCANSEYDNMVYICMCVCVCVYVSVHICVCECVCIYIHTHICLCVYTCTYINKESVCLCIGRRTSYYQRYHAPIRNMTISCIHTYTSVCV